MKCKNVFGKYFINTQPLPQGCAEGRNGGLETPPFHQPGRRKREDFFNTLKTLNHRRELILYPIRIGIFLTYLP